MTILSKSALAKLIATTPSLIEDSDPRQLKGASYDLRLGAEYSLEGKIRRLGQNEPSLIIPPYQLAIVTTHEKVNLTDALTAHFGLRLGLVKRGLLFSNEPQIDPGYRGRLACLLFNLSNEDVRIDHMHHFATIEFEDVDPTAPPYDGPMQGFDTLSQFFEGVDKLPVSALAHLEQRVNTTADRIEKIIPILMTAFAGIISLLAVVLAILTLLLRG